MRTLKYKITCEHNGRLVGDYLKLNGYSSRIIVKIKNNTDSIALNRMHIKMIDKLFEGDELEIKLFDDVKTIANDNLNADIAFEDDDIIIYDKPHNMPTHPSRNHLNDTLGNVFASWCQKNNASLPFRPINRLDRDTTGLCVCAKNSLVASSLSGKINKSYTAILSGRLTTEKGIIDAPIRRVQSEFSIIKREVGEGGQPAITEFEVISYTENYTAVRIFTKTGRTHQIRVHFASLGHPLAGDSLYGGDCSKYDFHQLRCDKISFIHPITKQNIDISV